MGQPEIIFVLLRGQAGCDLLVAKELPLGVEFYHGCQINREPVTLGMLICRQGMWGVATQRVILICCTVCVVHLYFQNSVSNFLFCQPSVTPPFPCSSVTSAVELGGLGAGKGEGREQDRLETSDYMV